MKFELPNRAADCMTGDGYGEDQEQLPPFLDMEETLEEETRVLTAMALRAVWSEEPSLCATVGPGVFKGPRRYIGVMRPVELYCLFEAWCATEAIKRIPSFNTFLRALKKASPWLRFRKTAGQHANCDDCLGFKKQLKMSLAPAQRSQILEVFLFSCSYMFNIFSGKHIQFLGRPD
jgi:hypothetical protein